MPTALIWETHPERRRKIVDSLSELEIEPRPCATLPALSRQASAQDRGLALVGIGMNAEERHQVAGFLPALREAGTSVIVYEDGLTSQPLQERCRLLLSGARFLLDSAAADFLELLRRHVSDWLRTESVRAKESAFLRDTLQRFDIVFESAEMYSTARWVLRASQLSDLPVLLSGETGTGKELLARALHGLDPKRKHGPFVAVNCAALNRSLAETELFGHRRGAFTGAERDRKGLFRAADGGVLFLDEISELPAELQAKLLRVLQGGKVLGVGEEYEVQVDTRVVAATNRELGRLVDAGEFRADLYHRLNVLVARPGPLRERREDITALTQHFVEKYHSLRLGGTLEVSADFLEALTRLRWPGNVRQLENVVRRALAQKEDDLPLSLGDLPDELLAELKGEPAPKAEPLSPEPRPPTGPVTPHPGTELKWALLQLLEGTNWSLPRALEHCERTLLQAALERTQGNQSQTARLLGITPRSIYNKLHPRRRP